MVDQDERYKVMLEEASMKLYVENVKLRAEVEQLTADLELARTYQGIEAQGCPLCTYEDGVFVSHCSLHRQISELQRDLALYKSGQGNAIAKFEAAKEIAEDRLRLIGDWVALSGNLMQKIHDLQHTGSSPLCQQPTCKKFYEMTTTEKRNDGICQREVFSPHDPKTCKYCVQATQERKNFGPSEESKPMKLQDAVNRACREPSLVEALTWIATWECERAIEQAVEFGRTGIRTGAGDAAWDTCFRVCFTAVMEAWSTRVQS